MPEASFPVVMVGDVPVAVTGIDRIIPSFPALELALPQALAPTGPDCTTGVQNG